MLSQSQEKKKVWVGVDVSKDTFDVAVLLEKEELDLRKIPVKNFCRMKQGVKSFFEWVDTLVQKHDEFHVVMESTGKYSIELAAWIFEICPSVKVSIINPAQANAFFKSLGLRNKTDKIDARALAIYARERNPHAYEPLPSHLAELQSLSRERDALMQMFVAEKLRAKEQNISKVVVRIQKKVIAHLERQLEKIKEEMKKIVKENENLSRDVRLLCTIPGVGEITAMVVLAELGDLRRFERSRQLSAFAGLSPKQISSGSSVRKRTRLCKQGNKRIRSALYMSTLSVIGRNNSFDDWYVKLVDKGKNKRVAMGGLMRKILVTMRAILISGQTYSSTYQHVRNSCG